MKEGVFHGGPPGEASINIINSPIPEPKNDQVLIKVVFSGMPSFVTLEDLIRTDELQEATQKTGSTLSSRRQT